MEIEIYRTLDVNGEEMEIEFFCDYEIRNNGIGSYEFWGSREYDRGVDYFELMGVNWDAALYSENAQQMIKEWVVKNWGSIEKEVETRHKEMKEADFDIS